MREGGGGGGVGGPNGGGVRGRRPSTVKPRVRLLLTLFWLAHGDSQFSFSDGADVPASSFSSILRKAIQGILSAVPSPSFSTSIEQQTKMAAEFASIHGCPTRGVAG